MKLLFLFLISQSFAGQPVAREMDQHDLEVHSDFIFRGVPTAEESNIEGHKCPYDIGRWKIVSVETGDQRFKGKIISIARHHYDSPTPPKGRPALSKRNVLSRLYTLKKDDGCFELVSDGAEMIEVREQDLPAINKERLKNHFKPITNFFELDDTIQNDLDLLEENNERRVKVGEKMLHTAPLMEKIGEQNSRREGYRKEGMRNALDTFLVDLEDQIGK